MTESAPAPPTVALLGTGIMGAGMGRNLARAGLPLRVWNRTRDRAEPLAADGATVTDGPAEAVREADVIVTVLADGPTVSEVLTAAAEAGQLTVLASGPDTDRDRVRERVRPVFDAIGQKTVWLNQADAGTRLKLVTNSDADR